MKKFIAEHEKEVKERLRKKNASADYISLHEKQIGFLQAERLAHLMVMLAVALFTLMALMMLLIRPDTLLFILFGLFVILLLPYTIHYFHLENTVQRWYRYARELDRITSGSYDGLKKTDQENMGAR